MMSTSNRTPPTTDRKVGYADTTAAATSAGRNGPNLGRRAAEVAPVRLIAARDLITVARLSVLALIAWTVPEQSWGPITRSIKTLGFRRHAYHERQEQERVENIRRVIGDTKGLTAATEVQYQLDFSDYQTSMQVLRDYRPGGWQPILRLRGTEHIEAALNKGRGVILWVSEFASSSLVTKMALHHAGFRVSHLSRPSHGFGGGDTRFGMRFLNSIWTRIEEKYLKERVVIDPSGTLGAMKKLRERLHENGIVSITVGVKGRRTVKLTFFRGCLCLATGPLNLALTTKAPLLPVFTIRRTYREFDVTIGPPLDMGVKVEKQESIAAAAQQYTAILESYVREYPGLWLGWGQVSESATSESAGALSSAPQGRR